MWVLRNKRMCIMCTHNTPTHAFTQPYIHNAWGQERRHKHNNQYLKKYERKKIRIPYQWLQTIQSQINHSFMCRYNQNLIDRIKILYTYRLSYVFFSWFSKSQELRWVLFYFKDKQIHNWSINSRLNFGFCYNWKYVFMN